MKGQLSREGGRKQTHSLLLPITTRLPMQIRFYLLFCLLITSPLLAQLPDDVNGVRTHLNQEQAGLRQRLASSAAAPVALIRRMFDLGMWPEAVRAIDTHNRLTTSERRLLRAEYAWLTNDFRQTEKLVRQVLAQEPNHPWAQRLTATLAIEAWQLPRAVAICNRLLARHPADVETALVLGRALLLQKRYAEALAVTKRLQKAQPKLAPQELGAAYLLEANVYFWDQQPVKAEATLVQSLTLDPFNADARFSYGYAIWRRFDATQLNAMAAQWELALRLNPLHYQTHWHWGNGHTNRTFADYTDPNEKAIRDSLRAADRLFRARNLTAALALTRRVEAQYPASVLPAMHRASLLYSAFDAPNRWANLDTAQAIFEGILTRKTHYGPAHNGLSAVVKSKRIPYLAQYDSITTAIHQTIVRDSAALLDVFPDLSYYAGTFAQHMVWNQLYTSVAYFPMLARQGNGFSIPPLHIDLSIAMRSPFFRSATTFDNRQWMDIRGVGSGAASIEYTERGAYGERNVVLHEYVHLFHGRVLTDAENRRIRALYYNAMREHRTLDYYSQNNESEYFAQTYPAYFEAVKVHPLDFKSMNTTADLRSKDPAMYAFLDSLIRKERAALAGDKGAMASNWAQVYVNLSQKYVRNDPARAAMLLDTALRYDTKYLPAYLAYARVRQQQRDFDAASRYIDQATAINPQYAPAYVARARLVEARMPLSAERVDTQVRWYRKALDVETDYQVRAEMATEFREWLVEQGRLSEAVATANTYAATAPTLSTYLRDRRDEAVAFATAHRAMLGYASPLDTLRQLVAQRPQDFGLRGLFADALLATGHDKEAVGTLGAAQRILAASKNADPDFDLRVAEAYEHLRQPDSLTHYLELALSRKAELDPLIKQRLVRLLLRVGRGPEASAWWATLPTAGSPAYQSSVLLTKALQQPGAGQTAEAVTALSESIRLNPYNFDSQRQLLNLYKAAGRQADAAALQAALQTLAIKPGAAAGL